MPLAMSATETPTFAGASGVPVKAITPASPCSSRSYALRSRCGPGAPPRRAPRPPRARLPAAGSLGLVAAVWPGAAVGIAPQPVDRHGAQYLVDRVHSAAVSVAPHLAQLSVHLFYGHRPHFRGEL